MKKTLLITLIILLIALGIYTITQGYSIGAINILSYSGIKEKDSVLQQKIDEVSKLATVDFISETKNIEENKNKLKKAREQYEDLVQVNPESGEVARQLQQYETEYLWTKIGNHARTEGVTLKIDITKTFEPTKPGEEEQNETEDNNSENETSNTTNTSENLINTTKSTNTSENTNTNTNASENATTNEEEKTAETNNKKSGHYDLEFAVTGQYVGIADFLYDIENDSTLGFKIEDFLIDGIDDESGLQIVAKFKCKDIAIKDLIKTSEEQREAGRDGKGNNDNTNSSNNTENSTNSTKRNTSNSSNTTNSSN